MFGKLVFSMNDLYYKPITYENIYKTYCTVRKTCKNKRGVYNFSVNKFTNIYSIYKALYNESYKPFKYKIFMIFEPKPRLVMSQTVTDKIVNHFVANYYLLPLLEKKLVDCNVATRKGKGSKYADYLLTKYINTIRQKSNGRDIYALKLDVSKYFYNIDHEILLEKLRRDIKDDKIINLLKIILNETNNEYVNKTIDIYNKKYGQDIPYYKKGTGLSIGAMTSQFLAIYFLSDLDHYIKEILKAKYYIRYMDDFIILSNDINHLKRVWSILSKKLSSIKLKVNPKSRIYNLKYGMSFIGYRYISNEKFILKYKSKTIYKIRKKLKLLKKNDLKKYYSSYGSYYGYLRKVKSYERNFKMTIHEKYDYYKEKNKERVVLIKEGAFYKTFGDDAKIIWYLFNYKWYKDSIAFSINTKVRLFDELAKKGIGYIVVDDKETIIKGDKEVYNIYSRLGNISYDKYIKKEELNEKINNLIDEDINNYNLIKDVLDRLEKI